MMQFKETMLVHPVAVPGPGTLSWTVLGDDDVPVVPVDRFLAYLTGIGRSPNTVKAYAHDLKDYWDFIGLRGLDWREAGLEDAGEFVAWLQLPPAGRAGQVAVLPSAVAQVTAATVNRKLAAVSAFHAHQARNGADVGDLLAAWRTGGRGGWKPFLHHVSKGKPYRGRAISLKVPQKLPRILTAAETQSILDACARLRDRFLFALLHESGCRVGEALGLRHEDIAAAEREISIVSRENANGARAKSGGRTVPAGGDLIRLYADYLHEEYGGTDSDYVFINLFAEPWGQAWSYAAAYDLVIRLRAWTEQPAPIFPARPPRQDRTGKPTNGSPQAGQARTSGAAGPHPRTRPPAPATQRQQLAPGDHPQPRTKFSGLRDRPRRAGLERAAALVCRPPQHFSCFQDYDASAVLCPGRGCSGWSSPSSVPPKTCSATVAPPRMAGTITWR